MLEDVRRCVSRCMNFEQSWIIARGNQVIRNHPAKLPNQLRSSLSEQKEKVNLNRRRFPESELIRSLVKLMGDLFPYTFNPGRNKVDPRPRLLPPQTCFDCHEPSSLVPLIIGILLPKQVHNLRKNLETRLFSNCFQMLNSVGRPLL